MPSFTTEAGKASLFSFFDLNLRSEDTNEKKKCYMTAITYICIKIIPEREHGLWDLKKAHKSLPLWFKIKRKLFRGENTKSCQCHQWNIFFTKAIVTNNLPSLRSKKSYDYERELHLATLFPQKKLELLIAEFAHLENWCSISTTRELHFFGPFSCIAAEP